MKNILLAFVLFSCIVYCTSCSCNYEVDCIEESSTVYMNILSDSDSSDLVFGSNKRYAKEDLKIYSIFEEDTTFYTVDTFVIEPNVDSLISFNHNDFEISRAYIDFGDTDIDTLDIEYQTLDSECCGVIRRLNTVAQNGVTIYDLSVGNFIATLKK